MVKNLAWLFAFIYGFCLESFECERGFPAGPSFYWANRQVVFRPHVANLDVYIAEFFVSAAHAAMSLWNEVPCSDFRFILGEPTDQDWVGYDTQNPGSNQNIVILRGVSRGQPWRHPSSVHGNTTLFRVDENQGKLLDADIEINGEMLGLNALYTLQFSLIWLNLFFVLAHEFGHVLGLDHQPCKNHEHLMCESYQFGSTQQVQLSDDDRAGICFLYPLGKPTGECQGYARQKNPSEREALLMGQDSDNCGQTSGHFVLWLLLGLFVIRSAVCRASS